MSHPSRFGNAHGLAFDPAEKSIGIIPGLIRSTYRSSVKICSAISGTITSEPIPTSSQKPRERVAEGKVARKSVYRSQTEFGPSEIPGTWKQSVESLTAALEGLDMSASEDTLFKRGGDAVNGQIRDNEGEENFEVSDRDGIVEKCGAAGSNKDLNTLSATAIAPMFEILSENLLEFAPFKRLPPEIRLKIWRLAATHERIIAFETVENPDVDEDGDPHHSILRLQALSAIPPILRVNKESYSECRKLYRARTRYGLGTFLYNPSTDILYFSGRSHCSEALSTLFAYIRYDVPRVAIDISVPLAGCCRAGDSWVLQTMRCLHGYVLGADSTRYCHCQGLKEVLIAMESRPLWMIPSRINPAVCFRPDSNIGITHEQAALRKDFEDEIARIQEEQPSLFGPNAWVGDDKPTFNFVNLSRDKAGEAFVTLVASGSEVNELKVHHATFINDLRRNTGCKIILPHQKDNDEFPMEIGIKGTKEGVELCRRKIQDMINLHT
ncbi:hypothetical protein BKA64DRAFT_712867 [Cadophora sp. MPI-SDFR-AT-0126]|nr:hypothetical protein BKA64DRAFT_712867 [Leotiomycetes sp. MPI-SDFR-AT-0126]